MVNPLIESKGPPKTPGAPLAGSETPKQIIYVEQTPGSGRYPARRLVDDSLPKHTVYAPKTPPQGIKMPVIVFGTGGCRNVSTVFTNWLTEVASHGYLVIANGLPAKDTVDNPFDADRSALPKLEEGPPKIPAMDLGRGGPPPTTVEQLKESIDWVLKGSAAKYGDIDATKIAASGQSCGGLQVRVSHIMER
jgi:hypothetical protein